VSPACSIYEPVKITVENPVSELARAGYEPALPASVVVPVLVIADPPRTAKVAAFPSDTEVAPELEINKPKAVNGNIKLTATTASRTVLFDFNILSKNQYGLLTYLISYDCPRRMF